MLLDVVATIETPTLRRRHDPLIAISAEGHQVAPPLVSGFMSDHLLDGKPLDRIMFPLLQLSRVQECIARKKDESRPSLTGASGNLCQHQPAVGIRPEVLGIEIQRLAGFIADHLEVP